MNKKRIERTLKELRGQIYRMHMNRQEPNCIIIGRKLLDIFRANEVYALTGNELFGISFVVDTENPMCLRIGRMEDLYVWEEQKQEEAE